MFSFANIFIISTLSLVMGQHIETSSSVTVGHSVGLWDRAVQFILDAAVFDAVNEAAFTIAAFFGVWLLGKALGLGRKKGKRDNKKVSKFVNVAEENALSPTLHRTDSWRAKNKDGVQRTSVGKAESRLLVTLKKESDALAKAVRLGDSTNLPVLIDAARERLLSSSALGCAVENVDAELLLAALRACAARRVFSDALVLYDHVCSRLTCSPGPVWSLLLWSAVETSQFHRCDAYLSRLRTFGKGTLTNYDFLNMTRYLVHKRDATMFDQLVKEFQEQGCDVDLTSRNRALAICVSSNCYDFVECIITGLPQLEIDTTAYETLIKGYAIKGASQRCFELYSQMRLQGLVPTEMAVGVLMDSLVDGNETKLAQSVFDDLKASGAKLNVVHWTTFLKSLVNTGQLAESVKALEEMIHTQQLAPDLVAFSTIMRGLASVGDVIESVRLLELMLQQGLKPDDVIFHTVLTACSTRPMEPALVLQVLELLLDRGLKPSTTTLSILVKAFAQSRAWRQALEVLESVPTRFRLFPETRIYAQLGQACAQARCGPETFNVYLAMVQACALRGVKVDKAQSHRLQRLCASVGEGERAGAIHDVVVKSEGLMDVKSVDAALADASMKSSSDSWRRSGQSAATMVANKSM